MLLRQFSDSTDCSDGELCGSSIFSRRFGSGARGAAGRFLYMSVYSSSLGRKAGLKPLARLYLSPQWPFPASSRSPDKDTVHDMVIYSGS